MSGASIRHDGEAERVNAALARAIHKRKEGRALWQDKVEAGGVEAAYAGARRAGVPHEARVVSYIIGTPPAPPFRNRALSLAELDRLGRSRARIHRARALLREHHGHGFAG